VNFLKNAADTAGNLVNGIANWHRQTLVCSAPSHAALYLLCASSIVVLIGGVYLTNWMDKRGQRSSKLNLNSPL
jgi:hypothetical protein